MTSKWNMTLALGALLAYSSAPASAGLLYNQTFDGTGNAFSSQNDTTGGNGNYATLYDNFNLATGANINEVRWVGEYFNPPSLGPISAFTVTFWSDAGGPATSLLASNIAGTSNESFLGSFGGFPVYEYSMTLLTPFSATAGTTYWLSIVPDLGFPPQWGPSSATGGDGVSYQDFFGSRSQLQADMTFSLYGDTGQVPEPLTLGLTGGGLAMLGLASWRRKKQAA